MSDPAVKDKEQLRNMLKTKIRTSSIKRMNNYGKNVVMTTMEKQMKEKYGEDFDINKLMQNMNTK